MSNLDRPNRARQFELFGDHCVFGLSRVDLIIPIVLSEKLEKHTEQKEHEIYPPVYTKMYTQVEHINMFNIFMLIFT